MKTMTQALPYGKTVVTRLEYHKAIEAVKAALKAQGFGLLCDIDVSETLRQKIGANFRPYRILGACNPEFAHRALQSEPHLGLLLPCNVVVQEQDSQTIVSAIDAEALLGIVGRPELVPIAVEVNVRLASALAAVEEARPEG